MFYLLLLLLAWKPIKYIGYDYFYMKDPTGTGRAMSWLKSLKDLISPWSNI